MKLYVGDPVISIGIYGWDDYALVRDIPLGEAEALADELVNEFYYEHHKVYDNVGQTVAHDLFVKDNAPSIEFTNNGIADTHKAVIDYVKEMLP